MSWFQVTSDVTFINIITVLMKETENILEYKTLMPLLPIFCVRENVKLRKAN